MYSEDVKLFDDTIQQCYSEYYRKMKQFCFTNGYTFSEDTFNDTYVKCRDLISRKGLKDKSFQGCKDYFFIAFKKNTFQSYVKRARMMIDDEADVMSLEIPVIDEIQELEDITNKNTIIVNYILQRVREEFDEIGYHILRLRYLFSFNNKTLTFKQIKQITKVDNTRARLIKMNEFITTVVKQEITNKSKKYLTFLKNNFNIC